MASHILKTSIHLVKKAQIALLNFEKAFDTIPIEYSDCINIPALISFQNNQLQYYSNTPVLKTTLSTWIRVHLPFKSLLLALQFYSCKNPIEACDLVLIIKASITWASRIGFIYFLLKDLWTGQARPSCLSD